MSICRIATRRRKTAINKRLGSQTGRVPVATKGTKKGVKWRRPG